MSRKVLWSRRCRVCRCTCSDRREKATAAARNLFFCNLLFANIFCDYFRCFHVSGTDTGILTFLWNIFKYNQIKKTGDYVFFILLPAIVMPPGVGLLCHVFFLLFMMMLGKAVMFLVICLVIKEDAQIDFQFGLMRREVCVYIYSVINKGTRTRHMCIIYIIYE